MQGYIRVLTVIFRGKRVTCRYTGLHKGTHINLESHAGTQGYIRLHRVTWGYTGLQKATQGYIRVHRVT